MGSFNRERLCRLCGEESQDLIYLFENQSGERNLVTIIEKYVKVNVNVRDALPHQVCGPCVAKLDEVVDFVDTSLATQIKFRKLLKAKNASSNKVQVNEDHLYELIQDVKVELKETEDNVNGGEQTNVDGTSQLYKGRAAKALAMKGYGLLRKGSPGKLIRQKNKDLKVSHSFEKDHNESQNSEDVDSPDAICEEDEEMEKGIRGEDGSAEKRLCSGREDVSGNEKQVIKPRGLLVRCHICKVPFDNPEELPAHILKDHKSSDVKYMCPHCPLIYQKVTSMTSHQRRKHQDTLQSCPKCKKMYPPHYLWTRHMLVHTNTRPFSCDECNKKFKSKRELYNHKRTHKPSEERYTYCCELCGKRFTQKANLESHLRLHTGSRPFSCEFCGKCFSQRGNMEEHRRIHTGEKPFECDTCGVKFSRQGQLAVHRKTHTGEKPHKCRYCDKQFLRKEVLRKHERVHTDTRPYKCSFCEKSFRDQGKRKVHERLHTGERPFECQYCSRRFCESGNLTKHLRVHVKSSNSGPKTVQGGLNTQEISVVTTSSATGACDTSNHNISTGPSHYTNECVTPSQILVVPESITFTTQGNHLPSDTIQATDSSLPLQIAGPAAESTLITHRSIDEPNRDVGNREEDYRVNPSVSFQSVAWTLYQT